MTSRERVFRTLEFKCPDRVPQNLWYLPWVQLNCQPQLDRILARFPSDIEFSQPALAPGDRRRGEECRKGVYVDDWGCVWQAAEDGVMGEVKRPPLADLSALATYSAPWETLKRADWAAVNAAAERNLAADNPSFMLGVTSVRLFERMQWLRGVEDLLADLAYGTPEVRRLRDMVHEFFLAEIDAWCKTPCDGLLFWGDDWGSQTSLLVSPDTWRAFFKPLLKEYYDRIHRAGKKVFMHSDGQISAIYGDLVELGVDALNSQLFTMDIEELGRLYKGHITFWGEIDRQHILPFGKPNDVRRAVARVRRALQDASGGVIAQCEWGTNVPRENIQAMFEAWQAPLESLEA